MRLNLSQIWGFALFCCLVNSRGQQGSGTLDESGMSQATFIVLPWEKPGDLVLLVKWQPAGELDLSLLDLSAVSGILIGCAFGRTFDQNCVLLPRAVCCVVTVYYATCVLQPDHPQTLFLRKAIYVYMRNIQVQGWTTIRAGWDGILFCGFLRPSHPFYRLTMRRSCLRDLPVTGCSLCVCLFFLLGSVFVERSSTVGAHGQSEDHMLHV